MRRLRLRNCFFTGIFFLGISLAINAQNATVNIQQNEIIPELMEMKSDMTKKIKLGERYIIQLYNGDNNAASNVLKEVRVKYANWPSDIIYETPNYKVWIGNFRNRLEADRALLKVKADYPSAFIPKPQRG